MGRHPVAALSLLIGLLFSSSAAGQTELPFVEFAEGAYERADSSMPATSGQRPMSELAPDAFRFTSEPPSGKAYVFEGRRLARDATLTVISFEPRPALQWREGRRMTFRMSLNDYDRIAGALDGQLERGEEYWSRLRAGETPTWLCNDGSRLLTERIVGGRETWMEGDCGPNHPSHYIDYVLRAFTLDRLTDRVR